MQTTQFCTTRFSLFRKKFCGKTETALGIPFPADYVIPMTVNYYIAVTAAVAAAVPFAAAGWALRRPLPGKTARGIVFAAGIIFCLSAVVGIRKPDPRIFRLGVDALGLPPKEILVVGDSLKKDILPAESIGCRTAWLKGKGWSAEEDAATHPSMIRKLNEIEKYFV